MYNYSVIIIFSMYIDNVYLWVASHKKYNVVLRK